MMTGLDVIEPGLYVSERCLEEKWLEKSSSPSQGGRYEGTRTQPDASQPLPLGEDPTEICAPWKPHI